MVNEETSLLSTNYFRLPKTELWFCSKDNQENVPLSEGDFYQVRFQADRVAAGRTGDTLRPMTVSETQRCITANSATIHREAGFEQVVWRIPFDVLVRKLAALTGLPVFNELVFNPVLDLSQLRYDTLSHVLACVIGKIQAATDQPNVLVLADLEQAMLVSLLCQSEHNWRTVLDGVHLAVPWQVRRVEEYIVENWNQPIEVLTLADLTSASARSIFRLFRQFRGYTPREFIRQQRLIHARNMLLDSHAEHSIAAVAAACGFKDASHFAREFDKAFGETPSAMRRNK